MFRKGIRNKRGGGKQCSDNDVKGRGNEQSEKGSR